MKVKKAMFRESVSLFLTIRSKKTLMEGVEGCRGIKMTMHPNGGLIVEQDGKKGFIFQLDAIYEFEDTPAPQTIQPPRPMEPAPNLVEPPKAPVKPRPGSKVKKQTAPAAQAETAPPAQVSDEK